MQCNSHLNLFLLFFWGLWGRENYLYAALRQEIGWFDTTKPGELATRIKGDTLVVQEGIGIKLARLIQFFAQFVAGLCHWICTRLAARAGDASDCPLLSSGGRISRAESRKTCGAHTEERGRSWWVHAKLTVLLLT